MDSPFTEGLYRGETVLVTGGGTGIGHAVARRMGQLGARVAICGRREDPLRETVSALEQDGIEAHHMVCDIRDPDAVATFIDSVQSRFDHLDVLVNNAGGQFPAEAQQVSPKGFEAVTRNNLLGTWNVIHTAATRLLLPQKRGRIVNVIAQIARGFPGMVHTGAARAGVENMTRTLAIEWAHHGIRVNAVAPGIIRTAGIAQYAEELLEGARRATPLKRLGHPNEVADLVTYLGSRYADFMTGQTFYIDGGQSLWGEHWPIPDDVPQFPPYEE